MFSFDDYASDNNFEQLFDGFNMLDADQYNDMDLTDPSTDPAAAFLAAHDPQYIEEPKDELPKAPTAASIARAVEAMATAPSDKIDRTDVTDLYYRIKHTQIIVVAVDCVDPSLIIGEHKNGHREVYSIDDVLTAKKRERFTPYKHGAKRKRTTAKKQTTKKRATTKRTSTKSTAKKSTTSKRSTTTKRTAKKSTAKKQTTKRATTKKRTTRKQATSRRAA